MTDYWKSNPRKFCEVCRCWFGDNKASVDFHERGRRHQENVKKMLSSARQRSAENEKTALQTKEILASIEMAAAAAYLKDLEGGDPADARPPLPSDGTATTPSPALHPALAESFEFRKAKAHAEILTAIQERETKAEREVATMAPPPPPSQWQQAVTPEGQLYYYNIFTRGTLSYITLN
ncbi:WW domain-binding protein 4, partial [Geodia barretti]